MQLEDLVLMPAVDARRALAGSRIAFSILAPVGAHAGTGVLRVLRVRPSGLGENSEPLRVELVCGYESYERFDTLRTGASKK